MKGETLNIQKVGSSTWASHLLTLARVNIINHPLSNKTSESKSRILTPFISGSDPPTHTNPPSSCAPFLPDQGFFFLLLRSRLVSSKVLATFTLRSKDPAARERFLLSATTFLVVRHPFERLLSAFMESFTILWKVYGKFPNRLIMIFQDKLSKPITRKTHRPTADHPHWSFFPFGNIQEAIRAK